MHSAQLSVLLVALLPLVAGYIIPATHTVTQTFVQGLAGEFSNQAQVQNDPHFKPINVWYRPMEKASEANGITQLVIDRLADFDPSKGELHAWPFLTESAILNQGTEPYKKNVVIVVNAAGRIHLQSFRVKEEVREEYTGQARLGAEGLLRGLDADCLEHLAPGCDMVVQPKVTKEGMLYEGTFACKRGCRFMKGGKNGGRTYLNSRLEEGTEVYIDSKIELLLKGEDGRQVQHYRSADRFRLVENDEDCFEGQNRGPYQFRKTEVWTPDLR
mmetsp:Transcript_48533/g.114591  ORF Transcript_48533/g.114591 Transcript_48533/m.114591 type:complete len:272 (-) Transcript_48533:53-868(-)